MSTVSPEPGVGFVVAVPVVGIEIGSLCAAVRRGLAYGVVLFVGAAAFWMRVVPGMAPDARRAGTAPFFHLVYGAVLGLWLRLGVL